MMNTRASERFLATLPRNLKHLRPLNQFERRAVEHALEGSWVLVRSNDGNSASLVAVGIAVKLSDFASNDRWTLDRARLDELVPDSEDDRVEFNTNILLIDLGIGDRYALNDERRDALATLLEDYASTSDRRIIIACSSALDELERNLGERSAALLSAHLSNECFIDLR